MGEWVIKSWVKITNKSRSTPTAISAPVPRSIFAVGPNERNLMPVFGKSLSHLHHMDAVGRTGGDDAGSEVGDFHNGKTFN